LYLFKNCNIYIIYKIKKNLKVLYILNICDILFLEYLFNKIINYIIYSKLYEWIYVCSYVN